MRRLAYGVKGYYGPGMAEAPANRPMSVGKAGTYQLPIFRCLVGKIEVTGYYKMLGDQIMAAQRVHQPRCLVPACLRREVPPR